MHVSDLGVERVVAVQLTLHHLRARLYKGQNVRIPQPRRVSDALLRLVEFAPRCAHAVARSGQIVG
eukprot:6025920-Pleurochrysis_carterae.AAC.6